MCLLIGLIFITLCKIDVEVNEVGSTDVENHASPSSSNRHPSQVCVIALL
jgi:hypothetical protein